MRVGFGYDSPRFADGGGPQADPGRAGNPASAGARGSFRRRRGGACAHRRHPRRRRPGGHRRHVPRDRPSLEGLQLALSARRGVSRRTRAGAGAGAVRPHRHCRAPPARAARGRDAPQARDGAPRRPRRRVDQGEDERGDGVDRTGGGDRRDRRRAARVTDVVRFLESLPPGPLYGLITALAAIESIFPPVPADTAVALGAFLAGRGVMNAWAVFLLTWVANVGSAAAVYGLGRRYGRDFFQGRPGRQLLPRPVLPPITAQYRRHGTSGIFLSRLLPVWRAVVPPFAGVAGVPPVRGLAPLGLAPRLWD